jgi:hypothetical protein
MATAQQVLSGLQTIRAAVNTVALEWEPGSIARLEASRAILENSLPPLVAALEAAKGMDSIEGAEILTAAASLRKEAAAVAWLVDAAAAFLRSVPGAETPDTGYTAAGESRSQIAPAGGERYTG